MQAKPDEVINAVGKMMAVPATPPSLRESSSPVVVVGTRTMALHKKNKLIIHL